MKLKHWMAIFLVFGSMTANAANRFVPVPTPLNYPLTKLSATAMPAEQLQRLLVAAAVEKGWVLSGPLGETMTLTLAIRTHTAKVELRIKEQQLEFHYLDSSNLTKNGESCRPKPGGTGGVYCTDTGEDILIHRNYKVWVDDLSRKMQAKLLEAGY